MSQAWYRLFLPTSDPAPVADTLQSVLIQHGYQTYDPFPGGTGTPPNLSEMVRLFVAPPQADRVVVLGAFPGDLLPELQTTLGYVILQGWLSDDGGGFAVYQDGQRQEASEALASYLRADQTPDTLARALAGEIDVPPVASDGPPVAVVDANSLPPELQSLAQERGVDPGKANSIFQRLSGNLFGKLGKQAGEASRADQEQARAIFSGGGQDAWNSLHGQRVRAIASVLNLPDNWRLPAFETVRESYQIHRLRQRSPRMMLMPGDQEALDAVPDALDYRPVYVGR